MIKSRIAFFLITAGVSLWVGSHILGAVKEVTESRASAIETLVGSN